MTININYVGSFSDDDKAAIYEEVAQTIGTRPVFHNDIDCFLWSFDYLLTGCGYWCESINYKCNDPQTVNCTICAGSKRE